MSRLKRFYIECEDSSCEHYTRYSVCGDNYNANEVDAYIDEHVPKDCEWRINGSSMNTACKHRIETKNRRYIFCPYCGGKIVEVSDE